MLFRLVIGFFVRSRRRSAVGFLIAALKYPHQGEFDGLCKESEFAQVLVRVSHDDRGKLEFIPRQGGIRDWSLPTTLVTLINVFPMPI